MTPKETVIARQQARKNEEYLQRVFDSLPQVIWTVSADGTDDYNRRWWEYTGLDPKTYRRGDEAKCIHPEDAPKVYQAWANCLSSGQPFDQEYRLRRHDGSYRWHLGRSIPVRDPDGNIVKWYGTATDIEEQKRSEIAYQTLTEAIPNLVWKSDLQGRMEFANAAFARYTGMTLQEMNEKGWASIIHADDLPVIAEKWQEALRTGSPYQCPFRLRARDGTYRWMMRDAHPLRDTSGTITAWIGTTSDIHDLIQAKEFLEKKEAEIKLITDAIPAAIVYIDAQERYVFSNLFYETNHGRKREEILGKTAREVMGPEHYDLIRPHIQAALRGETVSFESRLERPGREPILISATYVPDFDPQGSVRGFAAISLDVTEQRHLLEEQKLYTQKLIELQSITSDLSKALNETQVLDVIEQKVFRAFHASSGVYYEAVPDEPRLRWVASTGYAPEFRTQYEYAPLNGEMPVQYVYATGEPIFLESPEEITARFPTAESVIAASGTKALATIPIRLNDRTLGVFLFGFHHPRPFPANTKRLMLTLAAHCAEALERARLYDLAESAVLARDNMISISAHELLTPVSGSKLQMQLLKRKLEQGADLSKEALIRIAEQTDRNLNRLSKLVNDMLDVSRIRLGKLTLKPERNDLSSTVSETVERARGLSEAAGCELVTSIAPDIHGIFDTYRVEQVVTNLVSNACRYAYGKPIHIELSLRDAGTARLRVVDQGAGIRKEDHQRIFERFERASTLNEKAGLGLGLFIVKQIVEAHGGQVWVESEPGRGATFIVDLPLGREGDGR